MTDLPLLYHTHHSIEAEDIPFWLAQAEQFPGPILELGCGTGRVLLPLAETGGRIFGVDNDANMLALLRIHLPASRAAQVTLIRGDFRHFCLTSRFGLILMPCNTFSTLPLADRQAVLNRVRLHSQPGAYFVVSMPNPLFLAELPPTGDPEVELIFTHPLSGNPVEVTSQWQRRDQGVAFQWHYDHIFPDGRIERQSLTAYHLHQEIAAIYAAFEKAGLEIVATRGDYDGEKFNPDESTHLIITARARD
ncbi:MAG: class I SAM-dependent methyltransferase [Chloroflexi bacterium]|jgi:SAM-dependent methyltransferase|nr:class I SAM-dependent methyltransferase [Chloroflexota bacterium]